MTLAARDIEVAAAALTGRVVRTATIESQRLSEICGARVHLKLENLQYTGSFKDRGACHKLRHLQAEGGLTGVVAASAGNHAQGVAYHARQLGVPATIVMPRHTAFAKVERTEALGAEVVLHGESLLESTARADEIAVREKRTYVHPYDDPHIIAGQGTVAVEMLEDRPDIDTLVVPIGGGGLISGMALWAKERHPAIRIVGVQTELCPAMQAILQGREAPLRTATLADGIAVKRPGQITREIVASHVDEILLVDEAHIERGIQLLAGVQKVIAEGAGAVALAALLQHPAGFQGRNVGLVISGGNIDARLLANVLLRGLKDDGRIVRVRIEINDQPGVLSQVAALIGDSGANILEIEHQRLFSAVPPKQAELDVVLETHGRPHVDRILADLRGKGFPAWVF